LCVFVLQPVFVTGQSFLDSARHDPSCYSTQPYIKSLTWPDLTRIHDVFITEWCSCNSVKDN